MQQREWDLIAVVLENCWRGDWDELRAGAYFTLLEPYDTADIERAVRVLAQNGSPFLPTVPEIISAIKGAADSSVPTWPEALTAIRGAIRRHGRFRGQLGVEQLERRHPMIASFAAAYGWERLCGEPVDDPDHGGAVLRRLEISYGEHVERQQDREANGLAIAAGERRTLTGGPRRTNPAELLRGAA